jgi:uncharacterized RDD family membrane protein YckC
MVECPLAEESTVERCCAAGFTPTTVSWSRGRAYNRKDQPTTGIREDDMAALLQTVPDADDPRSFELEGVETSIGRSDRCTIQVDDKAISRTHAVVRKTDEGYLVVDKGSANGTFVNGNKVEEHLLADGDTLLVGSTIFRFVDPPDPEATVLLKAADMVAEAEAAHGRSGKPAPPPAQAAPSSRPAAASAATPPPRPAASPKPAPTGGPPSPPPAPAAKAPPRPAAGGPPPMAPPASKAAGPPQAPAVVPPRMAPSPPPLVHPPPVGATPGPYAGFWIRVLACLVDSLILLLVMGVIVAPAIAVSLIAKDSPGFVVVAVSLISTLLALAVNLLYVLYFWARKGATPGKSVLGLKILREDGATPMGWGKAALRLLGYLVSGAIMDIGFIMVAFTDRKRGLHDMIAGTVVVRTR